VGNRTIIGAKRLTGRINILASPLYAVTVALVLLHSGPAYAYLDPGSGSALVSVITATLGSLWYAIKTFYYSLARNSATNSYSVSQKDSLVIFSEGKAYWGTFRPLIEELIEQKIPFRYRTLDLYDPALTIENQYMQSKLLSLNQFSLTEMRKIEAPVMISTTPNIGCDGFHISKPPNVDNLMHVFHHVGDISVYRKNSLDHYDSVILAGDFQREAIRDLEQLRGLHSKSLVSLGLPYLDDLYSNRPLFEPSVGDRTTILIGSSWGQKGCLRTYGTEFIRALSVAGFNLIIRPHPQSFIHEPEFIEQCKRETAGQFVKWDGEISPSKSMHESQLLISDTSSLRFDYAFLYEKPIITLEIPKENLVEFEASDLNKAWYDNAAERIGVTANADTITDIADIVQGILNTHTSKDLLSFRNETLVNFGNCAPHIVEFLKTLQNSEKA
jgi:hypothetical protein